MRIISIVLLIALLATVVLCYRPAPTTTTGAVDAAAPRRPHFPWRRHPHHRHHPRRHPRHLEKLKEKLQKKQAEVEALSEKIDLSCTYHCTAYHVCLAKGAWNGATNGCVKPSGCICNKFAF